MDMSGMSGMGMDMSTAGMFTPTNKRIAHIYWYLVVAVVGLLVARRVIDRLRIVYANRQSQKQSDRKSIPFRPENLLAQSYDTLIALCRELSYPQPLILTGKFSRYFTPPSLGRCLFLSAYWLVILTMLWSNTIVTSPSSANYAYRWEIVGFRAAWVSVTQLPLIYVLSGKVNLVGLLTGISYERLNWLHRWVARTIFLTVIVHWSFFFREWYIADFVDYELALMPMVMYGFGAWATLGWMVLTGFGFFRQVGYELWFLQHLAAALVLLWLLYVHVPSYARYNIWFAIGVVVFDRAVRTLRTIYINLHIRFGKQRAQRGGSGNLSVSGRRKRLVGYEADVKSLSSEFILVTIGDVDFSWKPGQHVYLSIPRAGIFDAHPFTIANVPNTMVASRSEDTPSNKIELCIKVHSGFTRRLYERGLDGPHTFLSFISGPWGAPPSIERFESLVFIATGNGSSFTVPIFQQALLGPTNHLRQIRFVWIIRNADQLDWFKDQLLLTLRAARHRRPRPAVSIYVFITGSSIVPTLGINNDRPWSPTENIALLDDPHRESRPVMATTETRSKATDGFVGGEIKVSSQEKRGSSSSCSSSSHDDSSLSSIMEKEVSHKETDDHHHHQPIIAIGHGRPDLDSLVRPVVEDALGETGILACGGAQFMGSVRNYVASLSDERAVHKGTGAQGIYLFCETYGW